MFASVDKSLVFAVSGDRVCAECNMYSCADYNASLLNALVLPVRGQSWMFHVCTSVNETLIQMAVTVPNVMCTVTLYIQLSRRSLLDISLCNIATCTVT